MLTDYTGRCTNYTGRGAQTTLGGAGRQGAKAGKTNSHCRRQFPLVAPSVNLLLCCGVSNKVFCSAAAVNMAPTPMDFFDLANLLDNDGNLQNEMMVRHSAVFLFNLSK